MKPAAIPMLALAGAVVLAVPGFAASVHRPAHGKIGKPAAHGSAPHAAHGEGGPSRPVAHTGPHWTYAGESGPDHWGEMSDAFRQCATGHMQSPVDLGGAEIAGKFSVSTSYRAAPLTILNNGHTIQVNFPEGSVLTSGIARYKLVQMHFHTPSEEQVYGIPYPMVAHFVHVDAEGDYAVLAIMFTEGAHNPELDKIIRAAPRWEESAHPVPGVQFDPARLLPANLAVYRYEGSLTTPPCTEGVRWHVATHRTTASAGQIAAIHAIVGDNARPVQPLYGRLLVAGAD